jgi:NitT/TauT family transport system ATP-binding protein
MTAGSVDSKPVLTVSRLRFAYEQNSRANIEQEYAICDLSLAVNQREIVCILGASGCGKSTLLNLISGLIKPQAGNIQLLPLNGAARPIGYIFQQDALLPWRTVEGNLMLASEISRDVTKQSAAERISQYLATFHLSPEILKRYPALLSGGMRQRASIIQSLMFNPDLLLLDEPFSALDFYTKLRLESEFHQLVKERGKAAILVTHDIEEAVAMGDRVFIMKKGGSLTRQFTIDLGEDRVPETARGTAAFGEYYRAIWSELQSVIAQ